jgi:cell division transport system permease protein
MSRDSSNRLQLRPNYSLSTVSLSLVLLLIGIYAIFIFHSKKWISEFKESINIVAELKETGEDVEKVKKSLNKADWILPGSVTYISPDEALETMKREMKDSVLTANLPNPFSPVITFKVKESFVDPVKLYDINLEVEKWDAVEAVHYQDTNIATISSNVKRVSRIVLGLGIFLLLIAFVLIYNTIKLALYARRTLIKSMELAGARWGFIAKPFLLRSLLFGLVSGIIAIILLFLLLKFAGRHLNLLSGNENMYYFFIVSGIMVFVGCLVSFISTLFTVRKYLQLRMDELS